MAGGEEYLIEPLVSAKNFTNEDGREGRPHVVYKRSSLRYQNMDQSCGIIGESIKNKYCILLKNEHAVLCFKCSLRQRVKRFGFLL